MSDEKILFIELVNGGSPENGTYFETSVRVKLTTGADYQDAVETAMSWAENKKILTANARSASINYELSKTNTGNALHKEILIAKPRIKSGKISKHKNFGV